MPNVVLDTNVLVSAALKRDGLPGQIVAQWMDGAFDLIVSPQLLAELEIALTRPKLSSRVTARAARELVAALRGDALIADDPPNAPRVVRSDPGDDYLVALARAAGAHVIVTGDKHLLGLANLEPPAVDPRRFLTGLRKLESGGSLADLPE